MTEKDHSKLCQNLKRLGYEQNKHVELYGGKFRLTSDPIVLADHVVVVDAVDRKSGVFKRIAIPLPVLDIASKVSSPAS